MKALETLFQTWQNFNYQMNVGLFYDVSNVVAKSLLDWRNMWTNATLDSAENFQASTAVGFLLREQPFDFCRAGRVITV